MRKSDRETAHREPEGEGVRPVRDCSPIRIQKHVSASRSPRGRVSGSIVCIFITFAVTQPAPPVVRATAQPPRLPRALATPIGRAPLVAAPSCPVTALPRAALLLPASSRQHRGWDGEGRRSSSTIGVVYSCARICSQIRRRREGAAHRWKTRGNHVEEPLAAEAAHRGREGGRGARSVG